ncbi:argininosuccinate lyase [Oceanicola granulosus HTCC2516]|uniref:Argininosuccinate lyase n=1 Tax=Oceanicola granulosus (strain ATCC BAA-861 / DSM 15982 / KCTC 12143 / HTCC2516) TaxID=314256 RepID=Q2CDQ8_OCEGH|nr:argininosuccinate lyase [Oceanicola granulosus HTCC2516]
MRALLLVLLLAACGADGPPERPEGGPGPVVGRIGAE